MATTVTSKDDPSPLEFLVGHDPQGGWFVVESHGLAGGLFCSQLDAFRYLAGDFKGRPMRIEVVDDVTPLVEGTCVEFADKLRVFHRRRLQ